MKKYFLYLNVFFVLGLLGCNKIASQGGFENAKPEQFYSLVSNDTTQIIDVRTPKEFSEGHLQNAVNIDYYSDDFSKNISGLNIQKPVYIYCRSGNRSVKSVTLFQKAGFTKIYNLDGGIIGWENLELPIEVQN